MKKKYVLCLVIIMSIIFFSRHQKIKNKKERLKEIILNVDDVKDIGEKYIVVKKNGKYGIIDANGNLVMNFNYDYIRKLSSRNYFLKDSNGQKIYDIESKKVFLIDEISYIGNDLYKISKNNKYGVIDKDLNVKIEVINDEISSNGKQILVINEKEKYLLDSDLNKKILKDDYESIQLGIGNYLYFKVKGRYGVIDSSEVLKVFPKYEEVLNLNDKNILIGSSKGENYFINLDKNIEIKLDYENYSMESANKIMVSKDNKIGYINNVGQEVIPLEYDGGFAFKDKKDFIQLKKGEFWYLLDLATLKLKKLPFEDIGEYVEGYMVVEKKEKYGYVNKHGEIKIPLKYAIAEEFKEGIAVVGSDKGFGVINKKGREIIELIYDKIFIKGSYIYVIKDDKYGLFSREGEKIIPPIYEKLGIEKSGIIYFKDKEKSGIIDLNKK
ncbi:MAG: WG repeat-containing protein [Fusobacteriaceae bacterium]